MKDKFKQLIELLDRNLSCNEICSILNISNKKLYEMLRVIKDKGFFVERNYTDLGDIYYKSVPYLLDSIEREIIVSPLASEIRFLAFSDIHLGNSKSRIDLVKKMYDYALKNGIHILFGCGDFLDGTFTNGNQKIEDVYEQVDYFLEKYPFAKNLLTFGVGGDHDYSIYNEYKQDFLKAVSEYRHDIIIPDYNNALIDIKDIKVLLHHYVSHGVLSSSKTRINLYGHSHKYVASYTNNGNVSIRVPSLSDININTIPSFLDMTLYFDDNDLNLVDIKQIAFSKEPLILSETRMEMPTLKTSKNNSKINENGPKIIKIK